MKMVELLKRFKHMIFSKACTDGCCLSCIYFASCYKDFGTPIMFRFFTLKHIKRAVWLYRHTRHECNHCCLWCPYFDQCLEDVLDEILEEGVEL